MASRSIRLFFNIRETFDDGCSSSEGVLILVAIISGGVEWANGRVGARNYLRRCNITERRWEVRIPLLIVKMVFH